MTNYSIKITSHTSIYGLANLSNMIVAFFLVPIYISHLSVSDFGMFSLLTNFSTLLLYLMDFGLVNALFRLYYDFDDESIVAKRRLLSTVILFYIIVFLSIIF